MHYYIYLLAIVMCCISCSEEYTPAPQPYNHLPVLLGELTPNQSARITLSDAKNITDTTQKANSTFSDVFLFNNKGKHIATFQQHNKKQWIANYSAKAGNSYSLQLKYRNKTITAHTHIPTAFTAKVIEKKQLAYDTLQLKIAINPTNTDAHFVVECWQYNRGYYSKLLCLTNNKITDNIKYHELSAPYGRVFFKISTPQQLTLNIITHNLSYNLDDFFTEIRIKKVTANYYEYLYNYELQQQDESFYLPYQNNYLGIWGGAYRVTFKL